MGSALHWIGKLITPESLRVSHDEARAEFLRATTQGGRIAVAATRLSQICLPHFLREEKFVFPILGLLPELTRDSVRSEMAELLPLISNIDAKHDVLDNQHQSIHSAIGALLEASHREKNREFAEFAHKMLIHEKVEDEVIYPAVVVIGNYLREKFSN